MKREHLYVNKNHPCLWLMLLCMAASAVSSVIYHAGFGILWGIVLPCASAILFGLTALAAGSEMLYRTSLAVWLWGLGFAVRSGSVIVWAGCILFCVLYTLIIDGKIKKIWLSVLCAFGLVGCIYMKSVADCLFIGGIILLSFGIKVHDDGKWHPFRGDRIDGRRVRTAQVMEQITAYFMPDRTGASNLFSEAVEITELERYIHRKRKEGLSGFGITHVVPAVYARTVAKYPAINRFIAGQKIYSHGDDIVTCMTIKKELTAEAPDSLIKVHLSPRDTAEDVYRKFNQKVDEAKNEMETTADATVSVFMMIPGLILKFAIWLLKCMDYFGLVPSFLLEISPFHGSIYFTNLGSLGIKPVFHHLYDFGTVPNFCAFGRKRREEELKNGEIVERKYLDITFNLDERICDGFYYASAIKYFVRLFKNPELLDEPPEVIGQDIP